MLDPVLLPCEEGAETDTEPTAEPLATVIVAVLFSAKIWGL